MVWYERRKKKEEGKERPKYLVPPRGAARARGGAEARVLAGATGAAVGGNDGVYGGGELALGALQAEGLRHRRLFLAREK